MNASTIDFPFGRDHRQGHGEISSFSLAEMKCFESQIAVDRKENPNLSNELRAALRGGPRWIKFRNEEMVPLLYFAEHIKAPDDSLFRVMPENNAIDIELTVSGATESLQIAVAYLDWAAAGVIQSNQSAGQYHHLKTKLLNQGGVVGIGPITERDGVLHQEPRTVSTPELVSACTEGLRNVLTKKLKKAYNARPLSLLVHAVAYRQMMDSERFHSVVHRAFNTAIKAIERDIHFEEIYVLDCADGYFVKLRNGTTQ